MFAVCVEIEIKPEALDPFLHAMAAQARKSLDLEPACQRFDVCVRDTRVFLYELYDSAAAFDLHLASDHFKSFDAAVADMIDTKVVKTYENVTVGV